MKNKLIPLASIFKRAREDAELKYLPERLLAKKKAAKFGKVSRAVEPGILTLSRLCVPPKKGFTRLVRSLYDRGDESAIIYTYDEDFKGNVLRNPPPDDPNNQVVVVVEFNGDFHEAPVTANYQITVTHPDLHYTVKTGTSEDFNDLVRHAARLAAEREVMRKLGIDL